jgi:hypothetical protein
MCLIIHKPENATVPEWLVESALDYNPDGVGIMSSLGTTRHLDVSLDHAMDLIDRQRDVAAGIHFRMRTHGARNKANVHPFKVNGRVQVMHNGIMTRYTPTFVSDGQKSDTRVFIESWLQPRTKGNRLPSREDIESELGSGNRLLAYDRKSDTFHIYNKAHGVTEGALWLSNTYAWSPLYDTSRKFGVYGSAGTHASEDMRSLVLDTLSDLCPEIAEDYSLSAAVELVKPYAGDDDDWNIFFDYNDGQVCFDEYLSGLSDAALLDLYSVAISRR